MKKNKLVVKIILTISSILLCLIFLPSSVINAKVIPNDKTGIPDKNLYQAILFELDKKSDEMITSDDLEDVRSIEEYYLFDRNDEKKVKSLKGLEKFKNLCILEISISNQSSLTGIEKLSNLSKLRIKNGKLKNVGKLKKLVKLESLTMENVNVEDWTALGQLKGLTSIEIDKCNLKSFRQIKKLTNLENLTVERTNIKNLKGIDKLTKLIGLYVPNNCLSSVSGLEKLTQLWDLDISNNQLTNLPSLKKFKNLVLEHTSFSGNKINEKEFKNKLSAKIPSRWINLQVFQQNTKKKLKVYNVENININTTKITGVTEKQIRNVVLMTDDGENIKTVKSDKTGKFCFKELDLSQYEGKKLKIVILRIYYDSIKEEGGFNTLKTVKFMVHNK